MRGRPFASGAGGGYHCGMPYDPKMDPDNWHHFPRDDAWRRVTLAVQARHGYLLQPTCRVCWHKAGEMSPQDLAAHFGVAMDVPILTIQRRLRCTSCGAPAGYLSARNPRMPAHTGR